MFVSQTRCPMGYYKGGLLVYQTVFSHCMNHIFMAGIQALARRASFKRTLATMPRELFHRGKVDGRITIARPYHKAHIMALFCQLCIQDFNVGCQVFISVSAHAFIIYQHNPFVNSQLFFLRRKTFVRNYLRALLFSVSCIY